MTSRMVRTTLRGPKSALLQLISAVTPSATPMRRRGAWGVRAISSCVWRIVPWSGFLSGRATDLRVEAGVPARLKPNPLEAGRDARLHPIAQPPDPRRNRSRAPGWTDVSLVGRASLPVHNKERHGCGPAGTPVLRRNRPLVGRENALPSLGPALAGPTSRLLQHVRDDLADLGPSLARADRPRRRCRRACRSRPPPAGGGTAFLAILASISSSEVSGCRR